MIAMMMMMMMMMMMHNSMRTMIVSMVTMMSGSWFADFEMYSLYCIDMNIRKYTPFVKSTGYLVQYVNLTPNFSCLLQERNFYVVVSDEFSEKLMNC